MNESLKLLKFGAYVFALPLIATAAASAHQWMADSSAITVSLPELTTVSAATAPRMVAIRNHAITLNSDGEVQGRISTIHQETKAPLGLSAVTVSFSQRGEIVKRGYTNDDGTFVIRGLKEGIYSFVAQDEASFATCGVEVIASTDGTEKFLELAVISPNVDAVRELMESELSKTQFTNLGRTLAKPGALSASEIQGSNRVELDDDTLRGQVVSLMNGKLSSATRGHIFRANEKVAEIEIGADGKFEVSGLSAGVHDILIVGPEGIAAVSFEAVSVADEAAGEFYTALQDNLLSNFVVALAPQVDGGIVDGGGPVLGGNTFPVEFVGNDLGGGIAAGGNCGCGGSFRGLRGRGLGRLLLPAIAAGIAIPIATSSASPSNTN